MTVIHLPCMDGWADILNDGVRLSDSRDLQLTAEDEAKADAWARYAWGYYASMDENADWERVVLEYLKSIRHDPSAEFVIEELLGLWQGLEPAARFDMVVIKLQPLADQYPASIPLNLVVADAHIFRNQFPAAQTVLLRLFRNVGWTEPYLIRKLVVCYLAQKDVSAGHALLRDASHPRRLQGNPTVEYSAAIFYNTVAQSPDFKLSAGARKTYQQLALAHAVRVADAAAGAEFDLEYDETMALVGLLLEGNRVDSAIALLLVLRQLGEETAGSARILAECYESAARFEDALGIWKHLSEQAPSNPFYHVRLGRVLKRLERFDDAVFAYETALQISKNPQLAIEMSVLYLALKQPEKALIYAQLAPPHVLDTYILRSYIYRQLGQLEEALKALIAAETGVPHPPAGPALTPEYYINLAMAYYQLKRDADIVHTLETALTQYPDDPELSNFLGYHYAERNTNLDVAERLIRKALAEVPDSVAYLDSLAWVYFQRGQLKKAAKYIRRALRGVEAEVDGVIFDHAGDIYRALGHHAQAVDYWRAALRNEIEHPEAVEAKITQALQLPGKP